MASEKNCSTAHSLIEITEKIKESIDSGKFGCGIFIDLKKALEQTVNNELKKLSLWLNLNRLALNVAKTNFVIFRSTQKATNYNVTLLMNKKALTKRSCKIS